MSFCYTILSKVDAHVGIQRKQMQREKFFTSFCFFHCLINIYSWAGILHFDKLKSTILGTKCTFVTNNKIVAALNIPPLAVVNPLLLGEKPARGLPLYKPVTILYIPVMSYTRINHHLYTGDPALLENMQPVYGSSSMAASLRQLLYDSSSTAAPLWQRLYGSSSMAAAAPQLAAAGFKPLTPSRSFCDVKPGLTGSHHWPVAIDFTTWVVLFASSLHGRLTCLNLISY
jgi:hypothetical protein